MSDWKQFTGARKNSVTPGRMKVGEEISRVGVSASTKSRLRKLMARAMASGMAFQVRECDGTFGIRRVQ
jgi:hypothetical protein